MRKLIYSMGVSLDGFIAGPGGDIGWSAPDEELHRFHNAGGAGLAASLLALGLVDEVRPIVYPVVLGGGTPFFPALDTPLELRLLETRTFGSRVVYLRYAIGATPA